jgi:hypothetical protein
MYSTPLSVRTQLPSGRHSQTRHRNDSRRLLGTLRSPELSEWCFVTSSSDLGRHPGARPASQDAAQAPGLWRRLLRNGWKDTQRSRRRFSFVAVVPTCVVANPFAPERAMRIPFVEFALVRPVHKTGNSVARHHVATLAALDWCRRIWRSPRLRQGLLRCVGPTLAARPVALIVV